MRNAMRIAPTAVTIVCSWLVNPASAVQPQATYRGKIADKPLFRDPVYDGAADPVLCFNQAENKWFMFYTNRRANVPGTVGVSWVHGTPIGIAESVDGGATWKYRGTADIGFSKGEDTYWAPDVIEHDGTYHMYLTYVPGIFADWNASRDIIHLTSKDLLGWKYQSTLKLSSNRVIDASVFRLSDGTWRMWYNNEVDRKSIYYADSKNLYDWQDKGKAVGARGEGPKVFRWKDHIWMVVDVWDGLSVYRSEDGSIWQLQQKNLLKQPGTGQDDQVKGGHPHVVVSRDRAYLFYFTHPGRRGPDANKDTYEQRRSSIQVVELKFEDGWLACDRDKPTYISLDRPAEVPGNIRANLNIRNPLIEQRADPWCLQHTDGKYYFTATVPEYDRIELRVADTVGGLTTVRPKVLWRKHDKGPMSYHIWAPEIHHVHGKWYIYFAAGRAEDIWAIRMYVLECSDADPMTGRWIEKGQLKTNWESFSLDATTFEHNRKRYLVWAQKDPAINVAEMASPRSIRGKQVMITRPEYTWEKTGYWVNEGPAILIRNGRVFISYSASATDHNYCMGLLTADDSSNLLDPGSWRKSPYPVFKSCAKNSQYGPGHNSFTVASDGKTDLLVYHARDYKEITGDPLRNPDRHTRVQRLRWKRDGMPDFGEPVHDGLLP
jgi:GH43 family beta-xylosidase